LGGLLFLSESKYGERLIGIDVGICALFGGYTVLSTKALSSLLSTIFLNAFRKPIGWILLLVLAGTSILQVKYLNRALIRFESKVSRRSGYGQAAEHLLTSAGGHTDPIRLFFLVW
jgi:hypothetical protein